MAAAWAAAARQAASLSRLSSPKSAAQASNLLQRRGLEGGGDHHGSPKVNCWQDPLTPSRWKEEHFVIVSFSGCALLFYGGYKFFSGGKKDKMEEVVMYLIGHATVLLSHSLITLYYMLHGNFPTFSTKRHMMY